MLTDQNIELLLKHNKVDLLLHAADKILSKNQTVQIKGYSFFVAVAQNDNVPPEVKEEIFKKIESHKNLFIPDNLIYLYIFNGKIMDLIELCEKHYGLLTIERLAKVLLYYSSFNDPKYNSEREKYLNWYFSLEQTRHKLFVNEQALAESKPAISYYYQKYKKFPEKVFVEFDEIPNYKVRWKDDIRRILEEIAYTNLGNFQNDYEKYKEQKQSSLKESCLNESLDQNQIQMLIKNNRQDLLFKAVQKVISDSKYTISADNMVFLTNLATSKDVGAELKSKIFKLMIDNREKLNEEQIIRIYAGFGSLEEFISYYQDVKNHNPYMMSRIISVLYNSRGFYKNPMFEDKRRAFTEWFCTKQNEFEFFNPRINWDYAKPVIYHYYELHHHFPESLMKQFVKLPNDRFLVEVSIDLDSIAKNLGGDFKKEYLDYRGLSHLINLTVNESLDQNQIQMLVKYDRPDLLYKAVEKTMENYDDTYELNEFEIHFIEEVANTNISKEWKDKIFNLVASKLVRPSWALLFTLYRAFGKISRLIDVFKEEAKDPDSELRNKLRFFIDHIFNFRGKSPERDEFSKWFLLESNLDYLTFLIDSISGESRSCVVVLTYYLQHEKTLPESFFRQLPDIKPRAAMTYCRYFADYIKNTMKTDVSKPSELSDLYVKLNKIRTEIHSKILGESNFSEYMNKNS